MNKKVYKVTSQDMGGNYRSAISAIHPCPVIYPVGEFAYPNIGKLFAFRLLRQARRFACGGKYEVWRATAINPTMLRERYVPDIFTYGLEGTAEYWISGRLPGITLLVPDGTLLCDAIRLDMEVIQA